MPLLVGTSGWEYRDWRGPVYPPALPRAQWLGAYAETFATVEVNNTFYRLPAPEVFERWHAATPAGFTFALKASRFLTHVKRLRDPAAPVARLLEHTRPLGTKLGPVLLQLPPTMRADPERLAATLAAFPTSVRVAVEPRHPSWFVDATYALLHARNAALCLTDRRGQIGPLVRTADWCYLRLHEGRASPPPCYGRRALAGWVQRLRALHGAAPDGYVYFNNDPGACAFRNALAFRGFAQAA